MFHHHATNSKKKFFTIPYGTYSGRWQDKYVWIENENKKIFLRFDVTDKCPKPRGQNCLCILDYSHRFKIYV